MPQNPSETIFHFPEVRVVEASAGSGKTYALAKRYVQLLLDPRLHPDQVPMRNILAITFTNKAAFEMKARILEFLKRIALDQMPSSELKQITSPIGIDAKTARQKAFRTMETLITNYNFFQVQTIDSFINALLSGCAFKIGLTANFRIKTNSREYLEYSLAQLIDQAGSDPQTLKLFQYFLHNYLYLENRMGWFPKEDMLSITGDLYAQHNVYGIPFDQSKFGPQDIIKKKKVILEQIKMLREALPGKTHAGFLKAIEKFLSANTNSFDVDSLSSYFARENVPVKKGSEIPGAVQDLWEKIQKGLQELCEQEAFSLFNPYIEVFEHVLEKFYDLSAKDDVLFLGELNQKARLLFDEEYITVEELYYRLATRFHHYLIDEFQDTSRLQWNNLAKMAEEALSTGGSLFYVGDRKQAIYGFRGGDVALFEDIKNEFRPFNVQEDFLSKNWRSQKQIVEFNNAVFSEDNLQRFIGEKESYDQEKNKNNAILFGRKDVEELIGVFKDSQQSFDAAHKGGYVRMEYVDVDRKEERDEYIFTQVTDLIRDLQKRFDYKDIAVLTRSNAQIEELTNWLLEEGIPVDSERTSNIQENALIQEMIAFLRFLNSPIDNISFVHFITGEIFSVRAQIDPQKMQDFVFGLRDRLRGEKDLYLYTEFRKAYPKIWEELIEDFFKNVGLYPLYEFVVSIYHKLECLENFSDQQGFLMHFLEIIKKQEEDHSDIHSFLEYLDQLEGEDLYVYAADHDAVRLLTIHKSKGLEFPVVILPFLGMEVQIGAQSADNAQSYVLKNRGDQMDLIRLKSKYRKFSPRLDALYAQEYRKSFVSELNSVYVGLTRAQKELYGFIPKKVKNAFNIAKFLIPEEICAQGKKEKYQDLKSKQEPFLKLPRSQYYDWIAYIREEFKDIAHLKNREQRIRGEVLHFILSFIGNLDGADKDELMKGAIAQARSHFTNISNLSEHQKKIEDLLAASDLQDIFIVGGAKVLTEQDIVTAQGHTKRIDRLVIKKDEVWIVDYKSSRDTEGGYKKQVMEYMSLVAPLYPKKKVRGFLVYFDFLEKEEIQ